MESDFCFYWRSWTFFIACVQVLFRPCSLKKYKRYDKFVQKYMRLTGGRMSGRPHIVYNYILYRVDWAVRLFECKLVSQFWSYLDQTWYMSVYCCTYIHMYDIHTYVWNMYICRNWPDRITIPISCLRNAALCTFLKHRVLKCKFKLNSIIMKKKDTKAK